MPAPSIPSTNQKYKSYLKFDRASRFYALYSTQYMRGNGRYLDYILKVVKGDTLSNMVDSIVCVCVACIFTYMHRFQWPTDIHNQYTFYAPAFFCSYLFRLAHVWYSGRLDIWVWVCACMYTYAAYTFEDEYVRMTFWMNIEYVKTYQPS